jgi:hypothetical protein
MRWKVEVHGHSFDLADFELAVTGLRAQAFEDGGRTFLYAETFERMGTAAEVKHAAEALLAKGNASLLLTDPAARSLTVGPVVDAEGKAAHFVSVVGTAHARSRVGAVAVVVGGAISQPLPAEPVVAKRARLINSDDDVARAAKLLNAPDKTLVSLAKALEIVKGDLGQGDHKLGGQRAAALAEVKEQDLLNFTANVNYPTLSGDLSRHAGKNKDRQPKPSARRMSHAEATALVRRAVLSWIDAKQ